MEVRRQFREIPGIMEGTGKPEYGKCVEISTKAALREMMIPGALTIITPLLIGLGTGFISGDIKLGAEVLGISLVTNAAAGVTGEKLNHEEVIAAGKAAATRMGTLLKEVIPKLL